MTETVPLRSCGIVMKGGITSGVVYPLAITELAQEFRFRNIGGTSAGAIAAAATAAAALVAHRRRHRHRGGGGPARRSGDRGRLERLPRLSDHPRPPLRLLDRDGP